MAGHRHFNAPRAKKLLKFISSYVLNLIGDKILRLNISILRAQMCANMIEIHKTRRSNTRSESS